MAEIYTTLEPISYMIKENSTLSAVTPIGKSGVTATSVSTAYARGTYTTSKTAPQGTITFTEISDRINFNYTAKAGFYDDDSFEFMITYSDGTKCLRIVEMTVKKVFSDSTVTNRYLEIWIEDDTDMSGVYFNSSYNIPGRNLVPTKIAMSASDEGLSVERYLQVFNQNYTKHTIVNDITKTEMVGEVTLANLITGDGKELTYITQIDLGLIRELPFDRTDYMIIRFKDFLDTSDGSWVYGEECIYVIFNARKVSQPAISSTISVPEYLKPTKPVFEILDAAYPLVPVNTKPVYNTEFVTGDVLENTKAHSDYDEYNNKTIRIGDNVPVGAVNLGYYYNAVASFTDTISIQETNTNIVSLKYAEEWVHKNGCPTKDTSQFPLTVEFEGAQGTTFEGYFGTLTRDYVIWDEKVDIDQEPEAKTIYQQFRGMEVNKIPMKTKYNDGEKSGTLTYTHSINMPLDFFEDERSLYTNKWELPRYWLINAKYEGIVSRNIVLYNGSAKYSGPVSKKDGLSNIDPEQDKELILYPDENGTLYDLNGNKLIDDELFYITDKFKDDTPLYFRYRLKLRIYNSIGKDKYGYYQVDNVKLVSENNTPISDKYKFKVFLEETAWNDIYDAYIYTSFIPTPAMPIYVMYDGIAEDAYVAALNISPLNVQVGIMERLSVVQAMDLEDYVVDTVQGLTQQSIITMNDFEVIYDQREKIRIQYVVSAAGFKTPPIDAEVINKKYALYSELDSFKDDDLIISIENTAGYMTAKDILLKFAGETHRAAIEAAKVFKVGFYLQNTSTMYSKDKILMYTDPDGGGLIYARTYCDTGLIDDTNSTTRYNRTLDPDSIYRELNGVIYKGFAVRCRNINQIIISAPDETNLLRGWYPKIKYSYFNKTYERIDSNVKLIYSVPEFHSQVFGAYGSPYKDIEFETPKFIGDNTVKTIHSPMYVKMNSAGDPINIKGVRVLNDGTTKTLTIESFNFKYGYVTFQESLSDNDNILISYSYEEQYYHYKGYYGNKNKDTKMIDFNINPSQYSTYTDTENEFKENQQCYNLFNKTVYFFLRPMRKIDNTTGDVLEDNEFTLYHKFNNQEAEGAFDLLIGRIFVRHHASQKSTVLLDTRSRGGGVIEAMSDELRHELEPDSDFYLDIGTLDGKPYQENSVLVIRFDKRILKVNGGDFSEDQVRAAVQKWSAFGMYPIIEYVDIISEDDMPQNTLKVNKHIENQTRYNPYIQVEVIEK